MVTMKSYEMATGFSSMNEDELFVINGGSGSSYGISLPSYTAPSTPNGWGFSNGGITYTNGNTSVTFSGTFQPSVTVTVTIKF